MHAAFGIGMCKNDQGDTSYRGRGLLSNLPDVGNADILDSPYIKEANELLNDKQFLYDICLGDMYEFDSTQGHLYSTI